ncbi:MAG: hypothetical protein AAGD14_02310 [Planctomycetota bacterium]
MRTLCLLLLLSPFVLAEEIGDKDAAKVTIDKLKDKSPEVVHEGLLEATSNQHKSLTSPLIKLLKHKSDAVRLGVIPVLGARTQLSEQKKAGSALAARLKPLSKKPEQETELSAVIEALHDLQQRSTIKALLDMGSGTNRDIMDARAMAVGNVPHKDAIEALIQFGYKNRRGVDRTRDVANRALRYATGENPRGGIEGWRRWWKDNEKTFDPIEAAEARASKKAERDEKEAKRAERKKKRDRKKQGDE